MEPQFRKKIGWNLTELDPYWCPDCNSAESPELRSSQPAIKCSKLTIETLEQGVKYVQS